MGKNKGSWHHYNKKKAKPNDSWDSSTKLDHRKDFSEEIHKGSYPLDDVKNVTGRYDLKGPKKKYALCIGYLGTNYQGLQINPDVQTIEKEVERALFLCGGIPEHNYGFLQKIQWSRAARTDAGVHAIAQCIAARLNIEVDKREVFISNLNTFLPSDIRIHTMTKVSKGFNAKVYCGKRIYHYLMPTYMLTDYNIVLDHINNILLDTTEFNSITTFGDLPTSSKVVNVLSQVSLSKLRECLKSFRLDSSRLLLFRSVLQNFVGTKNYHNYTTGKTFDDSNANRYIMSFDCDAPFLCEQTGVEFILLKVLGQSFLLNQIRKMVGMAIEVVRGNASSDIFNSTFSSKAIDVPMAPGTGLYLDELFYDGYNNRINIQAEHDANREKKIRNMTKEEPANLQVDSINDEDDEDKNDRELLLWTNDPIVNSKLADYRENVVWPHIYLLEQSKLEFVHHLDFLRVCPVTFNTKTVIANNQELSVNIETDKS